MKTTAYFITLIAGYLINFTGLAYYELEKSMLWTTKNPVEDVDTFMWVELPSYIALLCGIASKVYFKPVFGWLMVVSGIVLAFPNLLVVSSVLTFFGGLLYIVTGAVVLIKKNPNEQKGDHQKLR